MTLTNNEVTFQHGFKSIVLDLDTEKHNATLENLLKKYKDNLYISVPLNSLLITEAETDELVTLQTVVKGGSFYIVNLMHDAKGSN